MARRSRRSNRTRTVEQYAAVRRTAPIKSPPSFFVNIRRYGLRPRRARRRTLLIHRKVVARSQPAIGRLRLLQRQPRMITSQVIIQRTRVPSRVFRRPTRIRSALVRAVQRKSSKRAHACKCSNERSEEQREVTRRFIAGYGGRRNMQKKIGVCSCH